MKRNISMLFSAFVCLGLFGCGGMPPFGARQSMSYASTPVSAGARSSQTSSTATSTSDADMATLNLVVQTTGDAFMEKVKAVIGNLGYQTTMVSGFGMSRMIAATRQEKETAGFIPFVGFGSVKAVKITSVSIHLEPDGRTVQINVTTMGYGMNADIAKDVVERFKKELSEIYANR